MRLLTKEDLEALPNLGDTGEEKDPTLYVKLFYPDSGWTWWLSEYDPKAGVCYGLLDWYECDWGAFRLNDVESLKGKQGSGVQRDTSFKPVRFSELKKELEGMGKRF